MAGRDTGRNEHANVITVTAHMLLATITIVVGPLLLVQVVVVEMVMWWWWWNWGADGV